MLKWIKQSIWWLGIVELAENIKDTATSYKKFTTVGQISLYLPYVLIGTLFILLFMVMYTLVCVFIFLLTIFYSGSIKLFSFIFLKQPNGSTKETEYNG